MRGVMFLSRDRAGIPRGSFNPVTENIGSQDSENASGQLVISSAAVASVSDEKPPIALWRYGRGRRAG